MNIKLLQDIISNDENIDASELYQINKDLNTKKPLQFRPHLVQCYLSVTQHTYDLSYLALEKDEARKLDNLEKALSKRLLKCLIKDEEKVKTVSRNEQAMIDKTIKNIEKDVLSEDFTAIEEMLKQLIFISKTNKQSVIKILKEFLPEN